MKALCLLVGCLLAATLGRAQPGGVKFEGYILDAATRQPVPFAAVSVLRSALGTVSNAEGRFQLVVPPAHAADSVVLNCVGYAPSRLVLRAGAEPIRLLLRPQAVQLQAVAVVGYTPQTLLKQALRTTHARLLSPVLLHSYYREFVRVNGAYTKFADGLVDYRLVVNPRRPDKPAIQVRINASRARVVTAARSRFEDLPSVIDVEHAASGYEREPEVHSNYLDSTDFAFYNYELRESVSPVEEPFYVISFVPTTHDADHLQQGTVRIDKQTLCLRAIDSELAPALLPYAEEHALLMVHAKENGLRKHVEYRQLAGGCYLSFIRLAYGTEVRIGRNQPLQYDFSTEMLVSDLSTNPPAMPGGEQYHGRSLYKNGTHYQHPYWQEANVLPATPEEEAIIAALAESQ